MIHRGSHEVITIGQNLSFVFLMIVGTCLEDLPELAEQGIDQEVIRGVNASIYLGERQLYGLGRMISNKLFGRLAGEETVSGTAAPQIPR